MSYFGHDLEHRLSQYAEPVQYAETDDDQLAMPREWLAECVATVDRERMAVEVVCRSRGVDGAGYLWWFTLRGGDGCDCLGTACF